MRFTEAEMEYTVVLHRAEDGVSVSVPGLSGCWSEGETEQEALENIQDAIREYLVAVAEANRRQEPKLESRRPE